MLTDKQSNGERDPKPLNLESAVRNLALARLRAIEQEASAIRKVLGIEKPEQK